MNLRNTNFHAMKSIVALALSMVFIGQSSSQEPDKQLEVNEDTFRCLTDMEKTELGTYFVDNILGDVEATLNVANSESGGEFPAGSVISLVPSEVMVKHQPGWNSETDDWEFFELNVSAEGSEIKVRGTTEVINQFGGNCFGCHTLARPEWDLVCGSDHGCAPLPIPRETILAIQNSDPRCVNKEDA
ncbi:MAG: hypothetical protein AB8B95_09760 [Pseudohongiellaceae bacterium]